MEGSKVSSYLLISGPQVRSLYDPPYFSSTYARAAETPPGEKIVLDLFFGIGLSVCRKPPSRFGIFLSCPWHIDNGTSKSANYGILTLPFTIRTLSYLVEYFLAV